MPVDKLSIYIPRSKQQLKPIERLQKIAEKRDRSLNYMVVQALLEYVEREEQRDGERKGRG